MTLVVVPCRIVRLDIPLRCARVAGHRLRLPCRRAVADGVRGSSWWPLDHRLGHMNPWRRWTDHSLRLLGGGVKCGELASLSMPRGRYTRIQWTPCRYYEGGCHGAMRWISSLQVAACFTPLSHSPLALMSDTCGNSVFTKKKGPSKLPSTTNFSYSKSGGKAVIIWREIQFVWPSTRRCRPHIFYFCLGL